MLTRQMDTARPPTVAARQPVSKIVESNRMFQQFKELYRHRELVLVWTSREVKVRYKQSVLGGAWAILQPLSLTLIFSIIFTYMVKIPTGGIAYPVFAYSALLPWTFFATSVSFAVPALTQNMNLVTKIYFPREILPASAVAAAFVDFLVASVVFAGMLLFYRISVSPALLFAPVLLAIQVMLTLGIVLLASAVNVFYRDVRFLVPLGLQLWMYATPVIYPASLVPGWLLPAYMLNPMAGLIEAYRAVTIQGVVPDLSQVGTSAAVSAILFVTGYRYFKSVEGRFADLI